MDTTAIQLDAGWLVSHVVYPVDLLYMRVLLEGLVRA